MYLYVCTQISLAPRILFVNVLSRFCISPVLLAYTHSSHNSSRLFSLSFVLFVVCRLHSVPVFPAAFNPEFDLFGSSVFWVFNSDLFLWIIVKFVPVDNVHAISVMVLRSEKCVSFHFVPYHVFGLAEIISDCSI